jgi:pimeloyl-ACP methyl ester carboxylesterase
VLVTPSFAATPRWWVRTAINLHPRWLPAVRPPGFVLRRLLLNGSGGEAGAALTRAAAEADPRVLLNRLREYVNDPAADDPAEVGVPVLAVRGTRDRVLGRGAACDRPNVMWAELDAPHIALAAQPAPAADLVAAFAARVCGP